MVFLYKALFFSVAFFSFLTAAQAQITSSLALESDTVKTNPKATNVYDSIFFFKSDKSLNDSVGQLQIALKDTTDTISNFYWHIYRSNKFELILADTNVNSSSIDSLPEGLYKVTYEENTLPDSAYAWISILESTDQKVTILFKDNDNYLTNATCEVIEVNSEVTKSRINILDYSLGFVQRPYVLPYSHELKATPEESLLVFSGISRKDSIDRVTYDKTSNFPTKETTYVIEIKDPVGNIISDSAKLEPIHPKSDIDTSYVLFKIKNPLNGEEVDYYSDEYNTGDPKAINSAPLTLRFSCGKSENATMYIWDFGDSISIDTTYSLTDTVEHTYYEPREEGNEYILRLTTHGPLTETITKACIHFDTMAIAVDPSELRGEGGGGSANENETENTNENSNTSASIPNVFTPNGDGANDIFRIYDVSIQEFEIVIFNRFGRVVHKFKGPNIREWEGWDGRMQGTNQIVPTGVYYYVIKAKGYDGEKYEYPIKNKKNKNNPSASQSSDGGSSSQSGPITGVLHVFSNEKEQFGTYRK